MNIYSYLKCDVVNGDGLRVVCFFSGCSHKCLSCHSKDTWKFSAGFPFDGLMQDQVIMDLANPFIDGITFSGGDCLHERNAKDLLPFLQRIKKELPDKNVWCYTGFTIKELTQNHQKACLKYIDVLLDGKFMVELADPSLKLIGSANQKIYKKIGYQFKDVTEEYNEIEKNY